MICIFKVLAKKINLPVKKFFRIQINILLITGILCATVAAQESAVKVACSAPDLIKAINNANLIGGTHTLQLAAECVYSLTTIDNVGTNGDNGLPKIASNITISGSNSIIERSIWAAEFRFFEVTKGFSLNLQGVTLRRGQVKTSAGKIDGGAIYSDGGTINITSCAFTGNSAGCGGAIFLASGKLTVSASAFSENTADY